MTSIAIMNAKGGVGKSTLTAAIAETLSVFYDKKVLIIDSDGQSNLSMMMMPHVLADKARSYNKSIVGWLWNHILGNQQLHWSSCLVDGVSDVDSADSISILAGDMDLTLLERKISDAQASKYLRGSMSYLLREAKTEFDVILVDCAPGISIVTEAWLRECDYHIVPVKPDLLSISGINYLLEFKTRDEDLGFAELLGVVVAIKNRFVESENELHTAISNNPDWRTFDTSIPMVPQLQKAACYFPDGRSYQNKYPGDAGTALRSLTTEILTRIGMPVDSDASEIEHQSSA